MKKDKWLKWKIGAVASLGLSLLFQEVKSSAAFAAKVQAAGSDDGAARSSAAADKGQSDLFAHKGSTEQPSGQGSGNIRRGQRHRSSPALDSGGGEGSAARPGPDSGLGSNSYSMPLAPSSPGAPSARTHTRTGRS